MIMRAKVWIMVLQVLLRKMKIKNKLFRIRGDRQQSKIIFKRERKDDRSLQEMRDSDIDENVPCDLP